ncbi:reverse transcriptase domain-containing protein [Tanacetum coccineum]
MPSHIKTYDGSEDPEDHLKIFQTAVKTERWAMPTWCHMFNSTLIGNVRVWFDDLPAESIDSYDDFKKAFLKNYLQQKKYIKDPIELHNIKQQDEESTKDFVRRYKLESRDVKGAPECMRISRFVHGITDLELIKRGSGSLESRTEEIVSTMETTRGYPEAKFKKGGFWNQQRSERKQDRFTLLIKTPKEIFALEKGKFKASPPMTTPVEKRNHTKFCEFHGEVGHNTDEYEDEGTEDPMIIEAEIGGHCIHRMYVDGGSASEILYEHYFNRLRPEIKNQLVPATTPLIGFSGEIIWPIGQIQPLVRIGEEEHSALAWMNFVVVRSPSPYNGIIGRPGVRKLQVVPSTAHEMLKLPVEGRVITLKSSRLVLLECALVSGPEENLPTTKPIVEERVKVAINPEYHEQTI